MAGKIRLGIGVGDLALDQWRSLTDRVGSIPVEAEVLGLPRTTDHAEVLLDRVQRGANHGVLIPTRYVPIDLPEGVAIKAIGPRLTPLSAFLSYDGIILDEFEQGAVIGVEGPLQAAQLLQYRPELTVVVVPGAISDRLRRLDDEEIDALVVPAAYAEWVGIQDRVSEILPTDVMMPVAGQGSLSLLGPVDDDRLAPLAEKLDDRLAHREVTTERATVRHIRADGRHLHAAVLMRQEGETMLLAATIVDAGGRHRVSQEIEGTRDDLDDMARAMGEDLLRRWNELFEV